VFEELRGNIVSLSDAQQVVGCNYGNLRVDPLNGVHVHGSPSGIAWAFGLEAGAELRERWRGYEVVWG